MRLCRKATAWFPIAITNKRDAVVPSSRLTDPTSIQEVRECYVGDSPQPTREEYGKGLLRSSPSPIRTVAGKADENGQSFAQGSRNSCGVRPSVPALAHESEPDQCENAEKVGVYMTTPGIAIDWVVSRSSITVKEGRLNVQSGHREVRVEH